MYLWVFPTALLPDLIMYLYGKDELIFKDYVLYLSISLLVLTDIRLFRISNMLYSINEMTRRDELKTNGDYDYKLLYINNKVIVEKDTGVELKKYAKITLYYCFIPGILSLIIGFISSRLCI